MALDHYRHHGHFSQGSKVMKKRFEIAEVCDPTTWTWVCEDCSSVQCRYK